MRTFFGVSRSAVAAAMLAVMAMSLLPGCGSSTPESAVNKYLSAWQAGNWDSYKAAVTPTEKLTAEQEVLAKKKFEQIQVKFEDIKSETAFNPADKNRATVTLTEGKVTYTATILGKKKTEVQDVSKMDPKERPAFDTVKVNNVWYVDTKLG